MKRLILALALLLFGYSLVHANPSQSQNILQKKKKKKASPTIVTYSLQCQALTKKGTQCKRNVRSGGYCWQHGG